MFSFVHFQPIRWIRPILAFAFLIVLMSTPIFAQTFVTDTDEVTVPEGGTATFQVKLSAQPSSNVDVTVSWVTGGDTDITVISDSSLKFTKGAWDNFQEVTLEAAEDGDTTDGQATIRISDDASVIPSTDVTATEQDNDAITFVTDIDTVTVPEGGTATFQVKLSAQPSSTVNVTVSHAGGDSDIDFQSGSSLTFTTITWDTYQTVTIQAAEDVDAANGLATIRISDEASVIADKDVTATEQDNDINFDTNPDEVTVPEGGIATFQVKLSGEPSSDVSVTISHVSGDSDISIQSGSSLTFTTSTWDAYQTVTLQAAEDVDTANDQATIRISDDASVLPDKDITATEQDNDTLTFITDTGEITVPEGETATFQVKLSAQPSSQVSATVSWVSGDTDITVKSGSSLKFTASNWDNFKKVKLEAAEDDDVDNGDATIAISDDASVIPDTSVIANEQDNDNLAFVTDIDEVTVPEGGTADIKVKLSAVLSSDVVVAVSKSGGDEDLTVISGSLLTFTPDDWNKFQTVTLAAAEDDDVIDGEAIIQIRAPGFEEIDITAVEQDNDIADIYLKLNPHTGTTGNIIKISIDISNNTQEIDAFGLDFIYDYDLFTLKSIKKGSLTSDWSIIEGAETTLPGNIIIGGVAGGGKAIYEDSKGTLVRIWLKVKCDGFLEGTESEIRIENYLDDIDGFSPKPCTVDITLVPCSRVGDVNSDGAVTPGDAQNTLEIYLGKRDPEFCQKTTSDSNGDESTTPGDAQDIFEYYLGKRELPECHDDGSTGTSSTASFASLRKTRDKQRLRPYKPKLYALNTIGYSGKIVNIPIIITNPEGISSFSFEVNYLPELLEYTGIRRSQLTSEFDYLRGIEEIKGLVRVEGESKQPIKYNKYASLAVLAFRVKEGVNGTLPIIVYNPGKDLFNVEIDDGTFLGLEYFDEHERFLSLGKVAIKPDRTLRIPVKVSSAFNIKSFGLEMKYPAEKMLFVGINRGELTENFTAVEGNESEQGVVRVGGYNMSGIQERKPGTLVEIVFLIKELGGKIEIVKLVDDIQDFIIQKRRIRTDEKRDRGKKPWFLKSYDHR